jgi:hypothetical protein
MNIRAKKANLKNTFRPIPARAIKPVVSMPSRAAVLAALMVSLGTAPTHAKGPVGGDEKSVRAIINRIYAGYSKPVPTQEPLPGGDIDATVDGYEPPYSITLTALVVRWKASSVEGEVQGMGDFDWYCQCQDYDDKTARLTSQHYTKRDQSHIDADVRFTIGWRASSPLKLMFVREGGAWKLDDLKFEDGNTLRSGLQRDIVDAANGSV